MKLASSWIGDAPITTPSKPFYDEAEELDELDESKDGCGGVEWQPYVLKTPHSSNKMLHELAREIRGVEEKRGKKLRSTQYKTIFAKWESGSRPFLQPNHDYFTEFLAKLDRVTVPKGETLGAAFERAKRLPATTIESFGDYEQGRATTGFPLPRASRDGRSPTFHAASIERCESVRTVTANDFQLDFCTKDSGSIEIGRSRNPECASGEILLYRVKPSVKKSNTGEQGANMQNETTKRQTKPPVDREAVRVLAIELGAREAARRLGLNRNTVISWARRYNWKLPRRAGRPGIVPATDLHTQPGDVLIATHAELETRTKSGLARATTKAAEHAAEQ